MEVQGNRGCGRPRKSWMECITGDIKAWHMPTTDIHNRTVWRKGMKNRMQPSNPPDDGGTYRR